MIQRLKKAVSVLMVGAALSSGAMTVSAQKADAGIILAPAGIGIFIIIWGIAAHNLGLLILGTDGTPDQTALTNTLAQQYTTLDNDTITDLATAITNKTQTTSADASGRITVTMTRTELSTALAASNIEKDQPAVFNQIVTDLQ
jgi:hypothetical protein